MLMHHLQTPGIVFRESLMAAITQTSMGMLSVWIKTYQDTIPRVWLGVLGLHVYPSYTIPKWVHMERVHSVDTETWLH